MIYTLMWQQTDDFERDKEYHIAGIALWEKQFYGEDALPKLLAELNWRLGNENPKNYDTHRYVIDVR